MVNRESSSEIEDEAVRWIWRLDREGRTPDLLAALDAWLAKDRRRQGAFLQAEAAWTVLDAGRRAPGEDDEACLDGTYSARVRATLSRRRLIAAGTAVAAGAAGVAILQAPGNSYRTSIGEVRLQPLPDGSTASINTQTKVDVELTPEARIVNIAEGEVWFHVAKDPARPFVVVAGPIRVRAVGTAFSVRRRRRGADVLVTEGVVEVWAEGSEAHAVKVTAGIKAFAANDASISEKMAPSNEMDRALAWRDGQIDLAGETLAEAAAEFNRYNLKKLIVTDSALAQERVYGVFRTNDPVAFARAVRESLGAHVIENSSSEIIIAAGA